MKKVAAVIVTYNNQAMLRSLLDDLLNQTVPAAKIIVVDNASTDATKAMLAESYAGLVQALCLEKNIGSAGGYHEGIKLASQDHEAIWLLDDDVSIGDNSLEVLITWLEKLETQERVGAVRCWGKQDGDFLQPIQTDAFAWRGTLITRQAVQEIGLPRKEYFIYADDTEYSFRMCKFGYRIFWIPGSYCIERRTDDRASINFLGRPTQIYESVAKLYYAFRNQLSLYLEYRRFAGVLATFGYALKVLLILCFLRQPAKGRKIKAILEGIADGLKGKLGESTTYVFE